MTIKPQPGDALVVTPDSIHIESGDAPQFDWEGRAGTLVGWGIMEPAEYEPAYIVLWDLRDPYSIFEIAGMWCEERHELLLDRAGREAYGQLEFPTENGWGLRLGGELLLAATAKEADVEPFRLFTAWRAPTPVVVQNGESEGLALQRAYQGLLEEQAREANARHKALDKKFNKGGGGKSSNG